MDKIATINKEIDYLRKQVLEEKKVMENLEHQCDLKYNEIAKAYEEFYTTKINKEFVLYNNFPRMDAVKVYISKSKSNTFPLHEWGTLNIKELSEIIKYIYQFKTGKEYSILTIGTVESEGIPHLYLMIGNDKTLAPYKEYDGKFINSKNVYLDIRLHAKGQNIINIDADRFSLFSRFTQMGIECLTDSDFDKPELINYYNEYFNKYKTFGPSEEKQIFSYNICSSLNYSGGYKQKGIKDVMNFIIHPYDSYIAKVLISIIIYKRNNNILKLSSEDYNHIFDVLFREKVNIIEDSKIDIPKKLIYIPNEKSGL